MSGLRDELAAALGYFDLSDEGAQMVADHLLPLVAAQVARARAEAWDKGAMAYADWDTTTRDLHGAGSEDPAEWPDFPGNPYRAALDVPAPTPAEVTLEQPGQVCGAVGPEGAICPLVYGHAAHVAYPHAWTDAWSPQRDDVPPTPAETRVEMSHDYRSDGSGCCDRMPDHEVHQLATPAPPAGGPWTTHGHVIPGVTVAGPGRPPVSRCGGPRLCPQCSREAWEAHNYAPEPSAATAAPALDNPEPAAGGAE